MPTRKSQAIWEGNLKSGKGTVKLGSGTYEGSYSFESRFEQGKGTNPEELIAAAHAGCFSMALAHGLEQAGYKPEQIDTTANISIEKIGDGFSITGIELVTQAKVPDIKDKIFKEQAETAKENCPVSKALGGTKITLQSKLVS